MQHFKLMCVVLVLIQRIIVSFGSKLPTAPDCGTNFDEDRIIGGKDASLDAFPWLALIEYRRDSDVDADSMKPNFQCGGSLITARYVITAAHCKTSRNEAVSVRLGEHRISTEKDCEIIQEDEDCVDKPPQNILIESFTIHESFVPNVKRKDHRGGQNDIALIRLVNDAEVHFFVAPVCLPTVANNKLVSKGSVNTTVVAGWGITETGEQSDVKQVLNVPLVSFKECDDLFPTRIISKAQICAGGELGKDACRGDSGGPLMSLTYGRNPFWVLLGLVSYGPKCSTVKNDKPRPSVYVNVEKYLDWIESKIQ